MVIALDPGNEQTAFVLFDTDRRAFNGGWRGRSFGKAPNADVLDMVQTKAKHGGMTDRYCVIEMIASYGMPVGAEVFDTCVWIGRFAQVWDGEYRHKAELLYRREVKLHLCGQPRAKDANIRQSLIDRFGGKAAIKKGGSLYKVSGDVWSALAVAVTWSDLRAAEKAA